MKKWKTAGLLLLALVAFGCANPESEDELRYPGYTIENRSAFTLELLKNGQEGNIVATIAPHAQSTVQADNRGYIDVYPVYSKVVTKNGKEYKLSFVSTVAGANDTISVYPDYTPSTYQFPPVQFTEAAAFASIDLISAFIEFTNNHPALGAVVLSGPNRNHTTYYKTLDGALETPQGGAGLYSFYASSAGEEINLFVGSAPDPEGIYQVLSKALWAPYPTGTFNAAAMTNAALLNGGTQYPKFWGGKVYTLAYAYVGGNISVVAGTSYTAVLAEDMSVSFSRADLGL